MSDLFCKTLPTQRKFWDPSALDSFARCGYYGDATMNQGWHNDASALWWGTLVHEVFEYYDLLRLEGRPKEECFDLVVRKALGASAVFDGDKWYPHPMSKADRNRGREQIVRAVVWYIEEHHDNPFGRPYAFPDGTPGVELPVGPIELPLESPDGDPYMLCGRMDGVCYGARDTLWVRERKSTASTLSTKVYMRYSPGIQTDTYDLACSLLYPELDIKGVLLEALQTGVTIARFGFMPFERNDEYRNEHLRDICRIIKVAEDEARYMHEHPKEEWPRRKSSCTLYGACSFAKYCRMNPNERMTLMKGQLKRGPQWNPLER